MTQLTNPKFIICNDGQVCSPKHFSGGIYPACKGLSSETIKGIIRKVLAGNYGALNPDTPIQYVKGVGPKRAELFNKLGVFTLEDLLNHFPRDWILPSALVDIGWMQVGKDAIIIGRITSMDYQGYSRTPIMKVTVADDTGECQCVWFNGGYLRHQLKVGQTIMLSGKVELSRR